MEKLRQSHDAVLASSGHKRHIVDSALPWLGRLLLALVGHRPFGYSFASRAFLYLSSAILPVTLTTFLLCAMMFTSGLSRWNVTLAVTLCLFQLCVSFASMSLKHHEMEALLGPKEQQLDEYAEERGFLREWKQFSNRRFIETLLVLLFMVTLRGFVIFYSGRSLSDKMIGKEGLDMAVFPWIFWVMVIRYLMLCYNVLHVACGFQLALGSFTIRFFKELEIGEALEEWNVLQATLRQVSCKMSDSLVAMGLCGVASMAVLAEQVVVVPDVLMDMVVNWLSMFYPLILFFLYTMMRTAQVTENASRVAPLVNSWQFQQLGAGD